MSVEKVRCARAAAVVFAFAATITTAYAQPETGPQGQTVPWQAPPNRLNSVVSLTAPTTPNFIRVGTGSIIDKHVVNGQGWFCVLTADHVATPTGLSGPITLGFGDGFPGAQGNYGGADNIVFRGGTTVANGGLGGVDIALVGIRYGAVQTPAQIAAFNQFSTIDMVVNATTSSLLGTNMSELGYGGTGTLGANGMTSTGLDGNKRFQNNRLERTVAYNDGTYAYTSVQFDFDNPAGAFAIAGEGTSYGGDSGGPYLSSTTQTIGGVAVNTQGIIAVHTWGNSNATVGAVTPFWTAAQWSGGGGVPLIQSYVDWIESKCDLVPTPGSFGILFIAGLVAHRRRRN